VRRALAAEDGRVRVRNAVVELDRFDRLLIVGAGKAAARMAAAVEDVLGDRVTAGIVIVPYGQAGFLRSIDQIEASHPIPDEAGFRGTQRILNMLQTAHDGTLVLSLLSGGASALMVQPMPGISLEEKQRVTELLLRAGASITELNTVRKHISRVKGGWLAQSAYPATIVSLILSDVIGNPIDVIASGPTAPDPTTFRDAASVLQKYGVLQRIPAPVKQWIESGVKGQAAETPKSTEACFRRTTNVIIGAIDTALAAAQGRARELELSPEVITAELQGEARAAGKLLAQRGREVRKSLRPGEVRCLLSGGETTVTVHGDGRGGRNQELALAFALGTEGIPGITLLSAGTDGIDGPTDAAGAIVDGETAVKARASGMDPAAYLERNDSYSFFEQLDSSAGTASLLKTGQTGTNVMDLQILCIEKKDGPA
jgi:hydroxypyruvate reductase